MNRVVTTNASITAGQPIVANAGLGTLPFIQDGIQEAMANLVTGLLGTYTTNDLIVFDGVSIVISTTSVANDTATWTTGAIFYNNEIFTVPAGSLVKPSGVFLYVITDVQSPILDPIIFKDNSSHGPHRVRQITISSGTSGTGIADYGAATVKDLRGSWTNATAINSWSNSALVGNGKARFRKGITGAIEFQGGIFSNGATPTNPIIFNLPAGFRPSILKHFIVYGAANSVPGAYLINITSGGDVSFLNLDATTPTFGTTDQIYLEQIRFFTDN